MYEFVRPKLLQLQDEEIYLLAEKNMERNLKMINCKKGPSAGKESSKTQSSSAACRGGEHEGLLDDRIGILRIIAHRISIGIIDERIETLINQLTCNHTAGGSSNKMHVP